MTRALAEGPEPAEIVVVDDGSNDDTFAVATTRAAAATSVPVRVLRSARNKGKGAAVARGMLAARGRYRVFVDVDLAYGPAEIGAVVRALAAGADIASASRRHQDSRLIVAAPVVPYFVVRYLLGRLLNVLVRLFVLPGIRDSQAGLKGFRAESALQLFSGWLPRGFSFDIALLLRARRLGLHVAEVPVTYRYELEPSTVRFLRDTTRLVADIVQMRCRLVGSRFERWNEALTARSRAGINRFEGTLRRPAMRAVLLAMVGTSVIVHGSVRLLSSAPIVAAVSWFASMAAVCLFAWRSDASSPTRPFRVFRNRADALWFAAIALVALLARTARLGDLPSMVHGDSADCGILGTHLLQGLVTDVFSFSPWYGTPYISFVPYALSFWSFGVSVFSLRLPSAIIGTLVIFPLCVLAREWFGTTAARLVTAFFAVSHVAIHFSRIGLWNVQAVFYSMLAFGLIAAGTRRRRALFLSLAGVTSGLALYTYTAGRLIPLVAGGFLLARLTGFRARRDLRLLAHYGAGLAIAALPLCVSYLKQPEMLASDRTSAVWVLADANRPHVEATLGTGEPMTILVKQGRRTLAGLVLQGDASGQYATSQPLLSPVTGAVALWGLVVCMTRWRNPACLLLLLWAGLGLVLGNGLVIDPPSFTRLLVILPAAYLLAAVGALSLLRAVGRRVRLRRYDMVAAMVILFAQSALFNLLGYSHYARNPDVLSRDWEVLRAVERLGAGYDYYLFTGPYLLGDAPALRLFASGR